MNPNALRDAYASALLKRLEQHEGPVADAERYMERLDVLTGVDLGQKLLMAPAIEHGSDGQAGDIIIAPVVAPQADVSRVEPAPLPDVHEVQPRVETEAPEAGPAFEPVTPAAASPEPVPAEPYTQKVHGPSPRLRQHRDNTLVWVTCSCGCGERFEKRAYEVDPDRRMFLNKEHFHRWQRSPGAREAGAESRRAFMPWRGDKPVDTTPEVEEPEPAVEETAPVALQTAPAPATGDAPALITESACKCPIWWRGQVAKWSETVPNEGHHETCPLYRAGVHSWPYPDSGAGPGPHTIRCRWCTADRVVDGQGVPWDASFANPARVPV